MSKKETKKKATAKKPAAKKAAAKKPAAKKAVPKKAAAKKAAPKKAASNGGAQQAAGQQPQGAAFIIRAQYIRDISFENPNAVENLQPGLDVPEMDINIGLDARRIDGTNIPNFYEVALNVRAEAKRGDSTVFIVELQYGIAVSVDQNVPEDSHHPLILIEIPRLAFPYARQILSDITVQGGYPPLLLNPVDFHALYVQRFGQKQA